MTICNDYYLGLDIGTSSVGWAVTDPQYNLIRAKGKDLWGVRLFREAETGEQRRYFRISRRRRQREIARIGLLKEFFADEIIKVDPSFYQRLSESKYHYEDKEVSSKHSLFSDKLFTDKEYYKKYPTIFHLREELIENQEQHDIRLVFLTILNIFKHRGHFLNSSLEVNSNNNFIFAYEELKTLIADRLEIELDSSVEAKEFEKILSAKGFSRTRLAEKAADLLGIKKTKDKQVYEIIKSLCGLSFSVDIIYGEKFESDGQKTPGISFRESDYEEKIVGIKEVIDEDYSEILDLLKRLHDQALLSNILQGKDYLSQARVASYEKHKKDLLVLKRAVKEFCPEQYNILFRSNEEGSYSAYIGSVNSDIKQRRSLKKGKQDDIYSTIKKILVEAPKEHPDINYILNEIEAENFLAKQLTTSNGVIPNQLHLSELHAILENAKNHFPFLQATDDNEITVAEKIMELFKFQIPYYVGPLNGYHKGKGGNAWVVRKRQGQVLPWNFDEMIDSKKSSQEFIERLIRKCTYLKDESVMPKSSLLYEKFMLLNELNNLKIRGVKIDVQLKQKIYCDLFLSGKKVTRKKLTNYLVSEGIILPNEEGAISGVDGDFKNYLASYGKFISVLGDIVRREDTQNRIERIIFWGTVYGGDKSYFKENLCEHYSEELSKEQIKRILGLKFRDWGRLSKEFLEMPGVNKETGEMLPLIQMLWSYNENLMELMGERFTFKEELDKEVGAITKTLTEMEHSDLDDLYLSSPVKRMVWQTLLVVKELEKVMECPPKRIFVEMARGSGEKGKRTSSRKEKLLSLYKSCKEDGRDWASEINTKTDSELRGKKLYLYYIQHGLCMYTGEPIEINQLFDNNLYDIDHIYPRRIVKDDSIENNLVLVKKQTNAHKSDIYPIEDNIYNRQKNFWKSLLSKDMKDGFITREKYNRLINRTPLSDEQLAGFISRQIVETRQGTKMLTQILERVFNESDTVFVKAGNISDFRHDFDLLKVRSVNDFHHAQDAYLSIVVGNVYYIKFTRDPMNFIKNFRGGASNESYNMNKLFSSNIRRGNETAWVADGSIENVNSIAIVKKHVNKNTPIITKMIYEGHGELFNATLYSSKKANQKAYVPLKASDNKLVDVTKYGGYSSVSTAYFFLVEHEVKGQKIRTIEALPLIYKEAIGNDVDNLHNYCVESLGYINPDVRVPKIKMQSLIKRNGFYLNITGKTGDQFIVSNAVPLILAPSWAKYIKKIEKTIETQFLEREVSKEKNNGLYEELESKHLSCIFKTRPNPIGNILKEGKAQFKELDEKSQCLVLAQIMQISQLSNMGANLELIGGSAKSGISLISKKISGVDEFVLVNQSVTGLFRSEIDLLTI